jgi:hypothetical protein
MGDVYPFYLISLRIVGIAVKCPPSKAGRAHKKMIESPDIEDHNAYRSYQPSNLVLPDERDMQEIIRRKE